MSATINSLVGETADQYGPSRAEHTLEIYKLYVEMADQVSARRDRANSFFLALNTGLVGLLGYVRAEQQRATGVDSCVLTGLSGIVLCYVWYWLIRSYQGLNAAKFKVIHDIEKSMPLRPYTAEWERVRSGAASRQYYPLTDIEAVVPWVLAIAHFVLIVGAAPTQR